MEKKKKEKKFEEFENFEKKRKEKNFYGIACAAPPSNFPASIPNGITL